MIEDPDIDARVKDDFFLHALDLLEIKTSGVFQGCLCKLKIGVELLEYGVYGLLFRFCLQGRFDAIDLILVQFNSLFYKRHSIPPFDTAKLSGFYGLTVQ